MSKYIIDGGNSLYGCIKVQGAKNAVLPIFAACVLTGEEVVIKNVPELADVVSMENILMNLGVKIKKEGDRRIICAKEMVSDDIPNELAKELRSSVFLLGSVLGRMKRAKVAYPGGCDIGLRPIDIHIKGLRDMNVKIEERAGYLYCDGSRMVGQEMCLDYPSVGATENVMLAAVLAKGETVICNAAREPEIVDLQNFLNSLGAKVRGGGTSKIHITGVNRLHGGEYAVMPDRICLGTWVIATCMCGGEVALFGCGKGEINSLLCKLDKSSCHIVEESGNMYIKASPYPRCPERVTTQPYPGFPTDLQAQFCAYASRSRGTCVITENIFENRFRHVPELTKMGADITIRDRVAIIRGVPDFFGAEVTARDLRGGAALVLAGLVAQGKTIVNDVKHIDRGYEAMEETLCKVGAKIVRL